jgi:Na+/melibiose symporter-like transporter
VFLAGIMLDSIEANGQPLGSISPTLWAIFLLRFIAFAASVASTLWMAFRVREFSYDTEEKTAVRLSVLLEPIRNKAFFRIILIPGLWAMICGMIGNYFTLHLIENVKMSYTVISSANFISTPMILLITPIWTRILKQKDWIKTMGWAIILYSLAWWSNVLISAQTQYFYFLAIILGYLFSPGINMVTNNLIYVHMPKENRTAYFAFYSLLTTVLTFLGQAFGTWFVTATASVRFILIGIEIINLQMISGVAAVLAVVFAGTLLILKIRCKPAEDQV